MDDQIDADFELLMDDFDRLEANVQNKVAFDPETDPKERDGDANGEGPEHEYCDRLTHSCACSDDLSLSVVWFNHSLCSPGHLLHVADQFHVPALLCSLTTPHLRTRSHHRSKQRPQGPRIMLTQSSQIPPQEITALMSMTSPTLLREQKKPKLAVK